MNDSDGTYPPPPPVLKGTNPMAGEWASNGPTWTEYLANDTNALIHPYVIGGAVTNLTIWPTAIGRGIDISSFVNQTRVFFEQDRDVSGLYFSLTREVDVGVIWLGLDDVIDERGF